MNDIWDENCNFVQKSLSSSSLKPLVFFHHRILHFDFMFTLLVQRKKIDKKENKQMDVVLRSPPFARILTSLFFDPRALVMRFYSEITRGKEGYSMIPDECDLYHQIVQSKLWQFGSISYRWWRKWMLVKGKPGWENDLLVPFFSFLHIPVHVVSCV